MNRNEIGRINRHAGGSTLTKVGREAALLNISRTYRETLNIQIRSFGDLKVSHVQKYVEYARAQGLAKRTIQNQMAQLRTALRECGREKFADDPQISNKSLEIGNASRNGTHIPFLPIEEASRISQIADPGAQLVAQLQRNLGLRMQEAIRSTGSLSIWLKELKNQGMITVVYGTKGGRTRIVNLSMGDARVIAEKTIQDTIELLKQQKNLIESKTLEGACRKYLRKVSAAGFHGAQASHSLRCSWAKVQYERYLGHTDNDVKESLARLSLDLGHGDGRGRYCRQVYLRNLSSCS